MVLNRFFNYYNAETLLASLQCSYGYAQVYAMLKYLSNFDSMSKQRQKSSFAWRHFKMHIISNAKPLPLQCKRLLLSHMTFYCFLM